MRIVFPSLFFVASAAGTALAWVGMFELLPPIPVHPAVPEVARAAPTPEAEPEKALAALPDLTADQRIALAGRPLFSETRTPALYVEELPPEPEPLYFEPEPIPEPVFEEPEPEPPAEPDLTLAGYIRSDGITRVLLYNEMTGQDRWYALGETVEGWGIVAIERDTVTFAQNGIEFTVKTVR